jgi:hypothetical protein
MTYLGSYRESQRTYSLIGWYPAFVVAHWNMCQQLGFMQKNIGAEYRGIWLWLPQFGCVILPWSIPGYLWGSWGVPMVPKLIHRRGRDYGTCLLDGPGDGSIVCERDACGPRYHAHQARCTVLRRASHTRGCEGGGMMRSSSSVLCALTYLARR